MGKVKIEELRKHGCIFDFAKSYFFWKAEGCLAGMIISCDVINNVR
jgi:hypothetical protein